MPVWIAAALRMLALGFGTGAAFQVGERALTGAGGFPLTDVPAQIIDSTGRFISGGPGHPHKRRRRRRALTASDRADIAFIVGLLGPTAGKNFAVTLAGRSR